MVPAPKEFLDLIDDNIHSFIKLEKVDEIVITVSGIMDAYVDFYENDSYYLDHLGEVEEILPNYFNLVYGISVVTHNVAFFDNVLTRALSYKHDAYSRFSTIYDGKYYRALSSLIEEQNFGLSIKDELNLIDDALPTRLRDSLIKLCRSCLSKGLIKGSGLSISERCSLDYLILAKVITENPICTNSNFSADEIGDFVYELARVSDIEIRADKVYSCEEFNYVDLMYYESGEIIPPTLNVISLLNALLKNPKAGDIIIDNIDCCRTSVLNIFKWN